MSTIPLLVTEALLRAITLADGYPDWDTGPEAPPGMDGLASDWIAWAYWVGGLGGFFGIVVCAGMMMMGHRNRHNLSVEGATGMLWVIAGLCTLVMAGSIVTGVLATPAE
ncbi:hypothetical protein [Nocardiopsis halophila]|uniref:hypothetical protein n=1 Tax=Nocardiopsis halophila TaxID=141692 RepID=UPI000346BC9F|nr:hypothetical protein [Nocardiopsis halophila]